MQDNSAHRANWDAIAAVGAAAGIPALAIRLMYTCYACCLQDNSAHRANWDAIAAVRAAVRIPVLANGDVRTLADARALMKHTGADGVMSAEPLLMDPALFSHQKNPEVSIDWFLVLFWSHLLIYACQGGLAVVIVK